MDVKNNSIRVSNPASYPDIAVNEHNYIYAQMLSCDLAASKSEMTSIHQYVYQNWILNSEFRCIADTIARISMVEMHHFDILGQLIVLLGGNPKFQASQQNHYIVWNGNCINYSQNIKQILCNNIEAEQGAFNAYIEQAKYIKDEHISEILNRIALDEQVHVDIFKKFLSQI